MANELPASEPAVNEFFVDKAAGKQQVLHKMMTVFILWRT